MSASSAEHATSRPRRRWIAVVVALVGLAIIAGLVGLVWWSLGTSKTTGAPQYASMRPAWESAMKKAGVEATMPAEPTPITSYSGSGSHPFDAVFTAEEATALLNIYTVDGEVAGQKTTIRNARVEFPQPGFISLAGDVVSGDQAASATIKGRVVYTLVDRLRAPDGAEVSIEGFSVPDAQKQQAIDAALTIGNQYIIDAPKLIVVEAEVVDGGVRVKGQAPNKLFPLPKK